MSANERLSSFPRPLSSLALIALAATIGLATPAAAQDYQFSTLSEGRRSTPIKEGMPDYNGGFTFCRLQYESVRNEAAGLGWSTDYPRGDQNLLVRLSQLTNIHISHWDDWTPGHAVVRATDPDLFRCPFLFTSDVGTVGFAEEEVLALRDYFQKGGFLWVDDFWGDAAWEQWSKEIARILPDHEIVELGPDHEIFSYLYRVQEMPQIPNIGYWRRTDGDTRERGEESPRAYLRGIFDSEGRLMVVMSFNTDIADGWEREGESNDFFALFSPPAYGLAINVTLWAMTQ